ncbi:MAG: hypothetical protein LLF83_02685 [Methanobacterium sp.]|nr:hypothetical protein [Methanobacterium sp.]
MKIAAGGKLECNGKKGVIGAVIKLDQKFHVLTAYHVLKVGKCDLGSYIQFDKYGGRVKKIIWDLDLAIIEIEAPKSKIKISNIAKPVIGPAYSLNGVKRINCKIMTIGKTYHYLSFPLNDLPLPGDSGSPIIQNDKVMGILASIFYNNATGIAVSIEMFR